MAHKPSPLQMSFDDILDVEELQPGWQGERPIDMEERFRLFHAANPHVYANLRRLALREIARGERKLGIGDLYERLRREYKISTTGDGGVSLNNDYRAFYARLLATQEPSLRDAFELRKQTFRETRSPVPSNA